MSTYSFTSESVSEGHPDKIADQVSDAILDAYLERDPDSKVACECLITSGHLVIAGEVNSRARVDVEAIARRVIADIGYTSAETGFDAHRAVVRNLLHEQSREIHESVVDGGAGDQGLVFGYATDESPDLLPLPLLISHRLVEAQARLRKEGAIPWLRPDAKSQVTIRYTDGIPTAVEKVVFSTQHDAGIAPKDLRDTVVERILQPVIDAILPGGSPGFLVNPSGSFVVGGPHGDTGLTGRKIIVDTYGGSCPHGGGAFSGKDPSKVDRSGAYIARHVAKHIVAAGLARRCTVQISYAIGVAEPTSLWIDTHRTGIVRDEWIEAQVRHLFDLTPNGIIRTLGLKRPIYHATAAYGHFGKAGLPWEQLDPAIVDTLKQLPWAVRELPLRPQTLAVAPGIDLSLRTLPGSAVIRCVRDGGEPFYFHPGTRSWKSSGGVPAEQPFDLAPADLEAVERALLDYHTLRTEAIRKAGEELRP